MKSKVFVAKRNDRPVHKPKKIKKVFPDLAVLDGLALRICRALDVNAICKKKLAELVIKNDQDQEKAF